MGGGTNLQKYHTRTEKTTVTSNTTNTTSSSKNSGNVLTYLEYDFNGKAPISDSNEGAQQKHYATHNANAYWCLIHIL